MRNILYSFIIILFLSCQTDKEETVIAPPNSSIVSKGNRLVGIDLLDLTERGTFDENIAAAKELGINYIALHLTWSSIEVNPEVYTDPGDALALLNQVAVANNFKFSLTIRPIDLTGKTVPLDLENTRFNDSLMIHRFKKLLDFIFTKMPSSTLLNLQIGNEVDGYDTSNEPSSFWTDYGTFLNEMTSYVHSKNANVKVGFTGTLYGMSNNSSTFKSLQNNVDVIGVTYYPIDPSFQVKNPNIIRSEIENFIAKVVVKPIYFQEIGFQSSVNCNSTETKQADFYTNFFSTWDNYTNTIKAVNIVRLNDISLSQAQNLAIPYGINDTSFIEYLRTLGLKTNTGIGDKKLAFDQLNNLLHERGW